ncbi:MAG: proton-conducting transporter membrane subunit [Thermoproteus sp. AZ2]|uniref:Proton-conducting transporter membrane subunit n=1 Tax=Thermoproteus sp. AZ2 TaxID=1609232 RepID=A0ACC6V377_9CREN
MIELAIFIAAIALALLAFRLGPAPAVASLLATALEAGRVIDLGELPYIGRVELSFGGLAEPFFLTAALLGALVIAYSKPYVEHRGLGKWFYGVLALYAISLELIVAFENLIMVFLALELSVITAFVLIYYFGYGDRARIAIMFFIWSQIGSIAFLIGAALMGQYAPPYARFAPLASALLVFGLLVKMGTAGVHFWLPWAHAEAPTPLSALLSPVHVGLMAYWIWRLLPLTDVSAYALAAYGAVTAIYGSLLVFREEDMKRALADSTIANMGLLLAAAALGDYRAAAALFIGHALAKASLFMLSGVYVVSQGSRRLGQVKWNSAVMAGAALGLIALAGVFGLSLLGKALLAVSSPAPLAPLLYIALFATAIYNFWLFDKLYKPGRGEFHAPASMEAAVLISAVAAYALMAAIPWL